MAEERLIVKLTVEEKDLLVGEIYFDGMLFNPLLDADGDWIISEVEQTFCSIQWLKMKPLLSYNEIPL